MKKILINAICILIFLTSPVLAKKVRVKTLENISTRYPESTYSLIIAENSQLENNILLQKGAIIIGEVIGIKNPRHWRKDAYIDFKPRYYLIDSQAYDITPYNFEAKIKKYKPFDMTRPATMIFASASNLFLPGISQACSFVKGFNDANNSKLKSGFVRIYKDSPLSLPEKGQELDIARGDEAILNIEVAKQKKD